MISFNTQNNTEKKELTILRETLKRMKDIPAVCQGVNNKGGSDTDIMHTTPYHASYSVQGMLSIHDREQE